MTLKDNWQEYKAVLDRHGITKLYHFTDRDNLESIIANGGLYSWADCDNRGITIAKPGGSSQSRSLDRRDGLQNYVRVCFTRQHPMMFVAMNEGRISNPVILEIDPEVVYWKGTMYADRNATKNGARVGSSLEDFKRIHFNSVKATKHFDLDDDEQKYFQAEILVPNHIPLQYITNIGNFGISIPTPTQKAEISNVKIGQLSTEVTNEDIRNGLKDEFGAIYSPDGKRLLKGPNIKTYNIREGTIVICDDAFTFYRRLIKATIPVTNVLTSITIPKSVNKIGNIAFSSCSGLKSVVWNAKNCADFSYYNAPFKDLTGINTITFGNEVEKIPAYLCLGCCGLTSITIPNSVEKIGDYAFKGCSGLTSVLWNAKNCADFSYYNAPFEDLTGINTITFGNDVKRIPAYLCYGLSGLTSLSIPDSVTEIGGSAFSGCSGLTSITIPDSVTEIGDYAFEGCSGLTSIVVEPDNTMYDSRKDCNAIIKTTSNTLIAGCKNTIIPNSVTEIGDYAFSECSGLTSVTIPDSVTEIGEEAFSDCSGLESIAIAKENPKYDSRNNCNAIIETSSNALIVGCKSTIIPDSVTKIGDYAFKGCSGLTSITIPDSVTEIGYYAFEGCSGLTSITIPDSVTEIGYYAFEGCSGLTSITIPDSVTEIGGGAFEGCSGLTSITIPDSVTKIGGGAFEGCSGLTSITIPDSVTKIGGGAFEGCSGLTSITIPDSVTEIGGGAFEGCSGLTSVLWNAKNCADFSYYNAPFKDFTGINTITFGNEVEKIPANLCFGCSGLTSVLWNAKNCADFSYYNAPFKDLTGINTITFGNEVEKIPAYLCLGCCGLTSITIPNSVEKIGDYAFDGCSGLTSIVVEPDNTMYDSRKDCNAIIKTTSNTLIAGCKNTIIPNSVTEIGYCAFSGCSGLTYIVIPNSVTEIEWSAFWGCKKLKSIYVPFWAKRKFKRMLPKELHGIIKRHF